MGSNRGSDSGGYPSTWQFIVEKLPGILDGLTVKPEITVIRAHDHGRGPEYLTQDARQIGGAMGRLKPEGRTELATAMAKLALPRVQAYVKDGRRTVVVFLTDGWGLDNQFTGERADATGWPATVQMFAIADSLDRCGHVEGRLQGFNCIDLPMKAANVRTAFERELAKE